MTTTKIELRTVLCSSCKLPGTLNENRRCLHCEPLDTVFEVPDRTGNAILAMAGLIVLALCVFVVGVAAGIV